MRTILLLTTWFILLSVYSFQLLAEENNYKNEIVNIRSLGFTIQQGIPYYRLPEGKPYYCTGITAVFHQPFFKAKKLVNVGVDIIPQIWITKAVKINMEAGLNVALNLNIQIKKSSILAFSIGSGIHYFGMSTTRQATGFIFSDNFLASYKHLILLKNNKKFEVGFTTGYRHLSNLNIKEPNTGIDNIIIGISFDRIF